MKPLSAPFSAERLREVLVYDADTGRFFKGGRQIGGGTVRYVKIRVDGKNYWAHRLAWLYVHGEWPDGHIDHINGDPRDNRIANLRVCSASQNLANRPKQRNNASGVKGVCRWRGRWKVGITHKGRSIHIGVFDEIEAARAAYNEAAMRIFGEFARPA